MLKGLIRKTEERERELKERIKEIEAIKSNPVEEAKNKIAEYEGTIASLKSKLKHTEEDKKDRIDQLKVALKEKEEKLKILEKEFAEYKDSKDDRQLLTLLTHQQIHPTQVDTTSVKEIYLKLAQKSYMNQKKQLKKQGE